MSLFNEFRFFWPIVIFSYLIIQFILVAREAESLLKENNPDALNAALEVLKPLQTSKQYPDLIVSEDKHPFTECATFADEIKGEGMGWQRMENGVNGCRQVALLLGTLHNTLHPLVQLFQVP